MQLSSPDIRLLRVFEVVVRNKGLAAAQSELNVSLSTISAQISALELRFGFRLCERGRGGFRLTDKGSHVAGSIKALLSTLDVFTGEIADMRGELAGHLRIGVVDCVASDPSLKFDKAIANFRAKAPRVHLILVQGSPHDFQSQILNGDLDVGFGCFPSKPRGIETVPLYVEPNGLFCGAGHPLFKKAAAAVSANEVYSFPVVSRSYWHQTHQNNILFHNVQAETQSIEHQLLLVQSGEYIGFLPNHFADRFVEAGTLWPVIPDLFRYDCGFEAIFRSNSGSSDKLKTFVAALCQAHGMNPPGNQRAASRKTLSPTSSAASRSIA